MMHQPPTPMAHMAAPGTLNVQLALGRTHAHRVSRHPSAYSHHVGYSAGRGPFGGSLAVQRVSMTRIALGVPLGVIAATLSARRARVSQVLRRAGETDANDIALDSELNIDYTILRDLLSQGDFKAADAETRKLLIKLGGEAAEKRGWLYFAEVRKIPEVDMSTIDNLWQAFSKGKFGYSAQRKIWRQCREQFDKFAEQVSWFTGKWENRNWPDEFLYNVEAPVGHLPLTNCIRGAQVLQELLSHPALEKKKAKPVQRSPSPTSEATPGKKKSALSMLAYGRLKCHQHACDGTRLTGQLMTASQRVGPMCKAVSSDVVASQDHDVKSLAELEMHSIINEHGFVLPEIPDDTQASAFVVFNAQQKAQYLGFSKDLRNTLRTLLCRRTESAYLYKCKHFSAADNAALLELRTEWIKELGGLPSGNTDPRQKALWENPLDAGAVSARAYTTVATQRAKQINQILKDRGLKEEVEWKPELIAEGKVEAAPSSLSIQAVSSMQSAVSSRTRRATHNVNGKAVSFEIFYMAEFVTKGNIWYDVEITANKSKSTHRIIVGQALAASLGAEPQEVVEKAFAVLISAKIPRKTEGIITSEVFPINYFTAANVAVQFPEFLELFGKDPERFDLESAQWNFKQVHDYSEDDKRTIPAGPMGGYFDPAGLQ